MKQLLFKYVTQPIAKVLDLLNFKKQRELRERKNFLKQKNYESFMDETVKCLLDKEVQDFLNAGIIPPQSLFPLMIAKCVSEADKIFEEKKANGFIDEMNLIVK